MYRTYVIGIEYGYKLRTYRKMGKKGSLFEDANISFLDSIPGLETNFSPSGLEVNTTS